MVPYSVDTEPRRRIFLHLAIISIVVSTFVGGTLKSLSLGGISTGTTFALLFLLLDRYLWRAPFLAWLIGIPNLNGTWKGKLTVHRLGAPVQLDVAIRVIQRWTTMNLVFEGPTIKSRARIVAISMTTPGDVRLIWVYHCEPKVSDVPPDILDAGVTDVDMTFSEAGDKLSGVYYSRNRHIGELTVTRQNCLATD